MPDTIPEDVASWTENFTGVVISRSVGSSGGSGDAPQDTGSASGSDGSPQGASGQDTSGQDTSGQDTSGQDTSGQDTSGQDTSGQDTSGQDTSGQDTSGQDTSGQDTAGQDTGQDTSGQDTSGQDTSGQDTPGQDTPGQDTSGQDTSGQDTAGQDIPSLQGADASDTSAGATQATGADGSEDASKGPGSADGSDDSLQGSDAGETTQVRGSDGEPLDDCPNCYRHKSLGMYKSFKPGDMDAPNNQWIPIHKGPCDCEGKTVGQCKEPGDKDAEGIPPLNTTIQPDADAGGNGVADTTAVTAQGSGADGSGDTRQDPGSGDGPDGSPPGNEANDRSGAEAQSAGPDGPGASPEEPEFPGGTDNAPSGEANHSTSGGADQLAFNSGSGDNSGTLGKGMPALQLDFKLTPDEIAACSKFLDAHFDAVLAQGASPTRQDSYRPGLDGKTVQILDVVHALLPLTVAALSRDGQDQLYKDTVSQLYDLVQARLTALASSRSATTTSSTPESGANQSGGAAAGAVKTVRVPVRVPGSQKMRKEEVEHIWNIDAVANYNKAWQGGKAPPPLQGAVNLTFPTIEIDLGKAGNWDFSLLNQPQFGLAVDKGGLSGQMAINVFQGVWSKHCVKRLEADIQATLSNLKNEENPQFGGMVQLEFKADQAWGVTAFLADQTDKKEDGSGAYETNFSGGFGLVVHVKELIDKLRGQ